MDLMQMREEARDMTSRRSQLLDEAAKLKEQNMQWAVRLREIQGILKPLLDKLDMDKEIKTWGDVETPSEELHMLLNAVSLLLDPLTAASPK